ncbi:MAG: PepSY-associated TM helix domain-containing protein [Methylophaga sp.]|nr:PepSY-associated TM helix domain-containing protein [Methylophaga sp.]
MNRKMRSLHRTMGAAVAVFLLVFALTGIILNHSAQFKLDQHYVNADWLMVHYGIGKAKADISFLVDNKTISQFDTQLFIDARPVTHLDNPLVGAIVLEHLLVLATEKTLILLTPEGEFVERMGEEAGVPVPIQNIGTFKGEPVIQTLSGVWSSNSMLDIWKPISLQNISWSQPGQLPEDVAEELKTFFYDKGITIEQLIIDIHNGRILGSLGVWLTDFLSIIFLMLSLTGLWIWIKRR